MSTFQELGLRPEIITAITEMGFEKPTSIQAKAIPHILSSPQDLIARAQTGTGKTGAFGLPIIHKLNPKSDHVQALILCPTRELCIQITNELQNFSQKLAAVRITPVYGGAHMDTQLFGLKQKPQIVVGTPGRTLDLINRKKLKLEDIQWLVLDEADEMLSMGFKDDLDAILATTPAGKQTLLFSATMPHEILRIVRTYMQNPIEIAAETVQTGADNVTHHYYEVQARDRYVALKRVIDLHPTIYAIVFCRTRMETKEIAEKLSAEGYNADALHGDLSQEQREYTMSRFRSKSLQLLIATDVAARGLDVNDLTHVINYNLPDDPDTYIHRSGRTGRAHRKGISISIIHSREHGRIRDLERRVGKTFEKKRVPSGKEICEKQLFHLVEKVENVEVEENQIKDYLPAIFTKLSWLDREELIKRFVSIEFNRFLAYYIDAKDINVVYIADGQKGRRSERDERGQKDGRRDERGSSRRDERGSERRGEQKSEGRKDRFGERRGERKSERRDEREFTGKPEPAARGSERPKVKFTTMAINAGTVNKFNPKALLSLINQYLPDQEAQIGKIDVQFSHTLFDVDEAYTEQMIHAFKKAKFKGQKLVVDQVKRKKKS
jgi:ATP-dependent RNA helicase DeaD